MGKYPEKRLYKGTDMQALAFQLLYDTVHGCQKKGLVRDRDSFGCMVVDLSLPPQRYIKVWDQPDELIGFTVSWGPEWEKFLDNAAGKVRAAARTGFDTLRIVQNGGRDFIDGDFPHGGAAYTRQILVSVSALSAEEDDWVARMAGGFIATEKSKIDQLVTAS